MGKVLLIVRGLPGCGKTTFAKTITSKVFAADDFFMTEGKYEWDPARLAEAHADCLLRTRRCLEGMESGIVAVTNVFAKIENFRPYMDLAKEVGARRWVVDLYDQGLSDQALSRYCVHGVPMEKIRSIRSSWEF